MTELAVADQRIRRLGARDEQAAFDKSAANRGGLLTSGLDGPAPAAGTPNYFIQVDDGAWFTPAAVPRVAAWYASFRR